MKKILLLAILLVGMSIVLNADELEEGIKTKINADFDKNFKKCNFDPGLGTVTNFNGKYEFWKLCELENGISITIIESHKKEEYNKEIFFAKNGKLIYAAEVIKSVSINDFEQFYNYYWDCHYWINNGKIITYISLGNGKTETDDWEPESILQIYKDRMFQLKYRKVPPLPKFNKNESYTKVRIKMIKQGWEPYRSENADTCSESDIRCKDRWEMESCAGTGMANCRFLWIKNGQIIVIHTIGSDAVFSSIEDEKNTNVNSEKHVEDTKTDEYYDKSNIGDSNEMSTESDDNELHLCLIGVKKLYTLLPTLNSLSAGNNIKTKGNMKIITLNDVRGTKYIDLIINKINFKDRPSCYLLSSIYIYRSDRFLKDNLDLFTAMYKIFGYENINPKEAPLDAKDIEN